MITTLNFQNFCSRDDTVFCGVFDGHGPFGHMVAKKVRDTLPFTLSTQLKLTSESNQSGLVDENGFQIKSTDAEEEEEEEAQRSEAVVTTMDEQWCELNPNENNEELPDMYPSLKHALLKTCQQIDKELKMHPTIDCFCSGTTSVTLIKQVLCLDILLLKSHRFVIILIAFDCFFRVRTWWLETLVTRELFLPQEAKKTMLCSLYN